MKLLTFVLTTTILVTGACATTDDEANEAIDDQSVKGPVGVRALTLAAYDERYWGDYPEFSGGIIKSSRDEIVATLREVRQRHFRVWLAVVTKQAAPDNVFDRDIALAQIDEYAGLDLASFRDVLVGIYLIDEPQLETRWGPGGVPGYVVDGVLARRAHQVFPGYPISVRLSPSTLERLIPHPVYVDAAWGTYKEGRSGEIHAWMTEEHAVARRMGVDIMWSINAYEAPGDGPFITPTRMRAVGTAMARDAHSYGVSLWTKLSTGQDPVPELQTTAMRRALADVANAMVARE
jgi:hypothetical protein